MKIKLTKTQNEILQILSEAGSLELAAVYNSLILFEEVNIFDKEQFLILTSIEIMQLYRGDIVYFSEDLRKQGLNYVKINDEKFSDILPLESNVIWANEKKYFVSKKQKCEHISLTLTEKGERLLQS